MVRKKPERRMEIRKNMRGGEGEVKITHYFGKGEMKASCRLCAELEIAPGAGIGLHEHAGEDEVFIVQRGRGIITDGEKEVEVEAGDAILTGNGASHAVRNAGDENLIITAVIVQY